MCGAVMCTAGILGLKKKKHEDCDVFFVRTDNQNGWDEMVSRHCLADDVQRTPHKKRACLFASVLSILMQPTLSMMMDGWMAFDMVTVEQQFRLEMPPPRLNLTKACNAFLKSVAPHASVGHAAMDYEINRQMLLEAQKFPGGHSGQDDGWDNDDDVGTVGTLTTTEAGEISEDDDDEDEDCVPCYEDEADVAREDATHEAHMQQHFEKNRQKRGDGEPEMGAVDDAEDDDAPHFHFLKKAGIEAADSGKTRAVLAECWRASSVNISDGNNKKKPRTMEFIHHDTSTKGTLLEHNREEDGMTDDDIKELCKASSNLLHTLDATHSRFLKWHMKWDDEAKKAVRELEALIASALKQARAIGVSMTPKWHLLEDHILDQHILLVKNGWGGICWLDESFVERAHQEGVKEDRRTQGVKGHEAQQTAQFKAEERASNPKVEERRERNSRVARTRKRTRTEAVKAETDDKRQQMIMMATDGDEDVEMGAGHV